MRFPIVPENLLGEGNLHTSTINPDSNVDHYTNTAAAIANPKLPGFHRPDVFLTIPPFADGRATAIISGGGGMGSAAGSTSGALGVSGRPGMSGVGSASTVTVAMSSKPTEAHRAPSQTVVVLPGCSMFVTAGMSIWVTTGSNVVRPVTVGTSGIVDGRIVVTTGGTAGAASETQRRPTQTVVVPPVGRMQVTAGRISATSSVFAVGRVMVLGTTLLGIRVTIEVEGAYENVVVAGEIVVVEGAGGVNVDDVPGPTMRLVSEPMTPSEDDVEV